MPSEYSVRLGSKIEGSNIHIAPVGDHRMSSPENIELLCNVLQDMIEKRTWILVGMFLWGVPTGLLVTLFIVIVKSKDSFGLNSFNWDLFSHAAFILVPLFVIFGIILGIIFHKLSQRSSLRKKVSQE